MLILYHEDPLEVRERVARRGNLVVRLHAKTINLTQIFPAYWGTLSNWHSYTTISSMLHLFYIKSIFKNMQNEMQKTLKLFCFYVSLKKSNIIYFIL